ncbi:MULTISPECIES: WYL domain-containing protein [Variovorax]|jgi:hypothetical protein|uniref:WYL domain-containing protein n=1 Tax=Variovorax TaxID=34072 RepID=UPI000868E005|nr:MULTISPECIES: WYL domain-containing protein [Variovorax]MBN8754323.1 WYL domain-containing protein [Variovorax sp.]ODU18613.1 MAG: WYL domain-containing protein [Variovorax sp. SCN 67-85]ODV25404.1 MAG: WYL domain-containing protein [Variovorax sp. SCN 67-20]OJZ05101.1 MAG: WYL domain-containing protein [Variovorax sp. 67-131]UKI08976.1 WYL domain-containing protein [Variovorax paradoxus]
MPYLDQEARRREVDEIPRTQRERLAFIDFQLYFLGELRRQDLIDRFESGPAGATRDIAQYKEIASENLELDKAAKLYRPTKAFEPLFDHAPQRVLTALSQGFGQGLDAQSQPMVRCEYPTALNLPAASVIAPITRAIRLGKAVRLHYTSVASGRTLKELVPLALVDIGLMWQVRAFDRKHRQFRDYVLTRMQDPKVLDDRPVLKEETVEQDVLWNRVIELELVTHPNHPRSEIVEMDYPMVDGMLKVRVRAAHSGYMLRRWCVDCSPDHSLAARDFPLWLKEPLDLYGSEAELAPGYVDPRAGNGKKIRAM